MDTTHVFSNCFDLSPATALCSDISATRLHGNITPYCLGLVFQQCDEGQEAPPSTSSGLQSVRSQFHKILTNEVKFHWFLFDPHEKPLQNCRKCHFCQFNFVAVANAADTVVSFSVRVQCLQPAAQRTADL